AVASVATPARVDEYLALNAASTPAAEAVVGGDVRWTYGELEARVDRLAHRLVAAGVRRGDRVAMLSTPRPEFVLVLLALSRIGAVWVGLNPRHRRPELVRTVADAEPLLLVAMTSFEGRDYAG